MHEEEYNRCMGSLMNAVHAGCMCDLVRGLIVDGEYFEGGRSVRVNGGGRLGFWMRESSRVWMCYVERHD